MSKYWPANFDLEDTSSPLEILKLAKREWNDNSSGLLDLILQEAESANKNHLLIIHAKHVPSNRTVTLFSVVYRPNAPYPARIYPRGDELPDFLKKSYFKPGIADLSSVFRDASGGQVTNEWVCDTPAEFRLELENVFNLGTLKSDVLSLVSGAATIEDVQDDDPLEAPSDEEPNDSKA